MDCAQIQTLVVMAGLDPAIHTAARLRRVDHRVKPGGDEESGRMSLRELSDTAVHGSALDEASKDEGQGRLAVCWTGGRA